MQKIKKHLTMKELPVTERPYEKCEKNGAGTLSDAELLAIILKTGTRGDKVMDLAVQLLNLNHPVRALRGSWGLNLQIFRRYAALDGSKPFSWPLFASCPEG